MSRPQKQVCTESAVLNELAGEEILDCFTKFGATDEINKEVQSVVGKSKYVGTVDDKIVFGVDDGVLSPSWKQLLCKYFTDLMWTDSNKE